MWIKSFRIQNYKSFDDTGMLELDRHMNLLVGQNHSGKTAMLRSLAHQMGAIPHKNSRLAADAAINPISILDLNFVVSAREFRDTALRENMNLQVPVPRSWSDEGQTRALQRLLDQDEMVISVQYRTNAAGGGSQWHQPHFPSNNLFPSGNPNLSAFIHVTPTPDRRDFRVTNMGHGENDNLGTHFVNPLRRKTYIFDAQRIPQNDFGFGNAEELSSDAANLPQVLNVLQSNRTEFGRYVEEVRRIVPAIKWISIVPSKERGQNVEIRIWNVEESTGRNDLSIPLSESGTGIGQVLSILYVVLRSKGSVLVIDEPNSFLHPRAAKALMARLKADTQNQYIVSTHSPEVIVSAEPNRLFVLKYENEETELIEVDQDNLESVRQVLDEIGSRLSDVFGAEAVIWVEGPTEVECFPMLLAAAGKSVESGIAIAPLRNTGDLESKHGKVVADIYRNLSSTHALLPAVIAVSLDGDKENIDNKKILARAFGQNIRFLPRRCYENYLLHPRALTEILNGLPAFADAPLNETQTTDWVQAHGRNPDFKAAEHEPFAQEWIKNVDSPRLLDRMFQELSGEREIYRKPLYSTQLTKWLIQNDRGFIQPLVDYVATIMP